MFGALLVCGRCLSWVGMLASPIRGLRAALSPLSVIGVTVCCALRIQGVQTSVTQECLQRRRRRDEAGGEVAILVKLALTPV